jgi:hypothetical protein
MTDQTRQSLDGAWTVDDAVVNTRRQLHQRLRDPWMTEHDLWVLGQFAKFFSGTTPDPDPRLVVEPAPQADPERHLRYRVGRVRVAG